MGGTFTDSVTDTIRGELKRRGVSQAQLAEHLGVTQQTVSRRFSGQVPLNIDEIEAIASYLGLQVRLELTPARPGLAAA